MSSPSTRETPEARAFAWSRLWDRLLAEPPDARQIQPDATAEDDDPDPVECRDKDASEAV